MVLLQSSYPRMLLKLMGIGRWMNTVNVYLGNFHTKVGKHGVQILAEFWLCTFYFNAPGKRHELPSVRKWNNRTVQIPTEVSLF